MRPPDKSLADVVVGRALQLERDAPREERAEALAGDAFERDVDRVFGQPFVAVLARDRAREHRADRAVGVADAEREPHRLLFLERRLRTRDQLVVERSARVRGPASRPGGARLPAGIFGW